MFLYTVCAPWQVFLDCLSFDPNMISYLGWCCMAWLSSRLTEMAIVRYIYRIQFSLYFSRIAYLVSSVQTCSTSAYLFLNLPVKQFRALSDQFYRTPEHHRFVRQQVVNQVSIFKMTAYISFLLTVKGHTIRIILSVDKYSYENWLCLSVLLRS